MSYERSSDASKHQSSTQRSIVNSESTPTPVVIPPTLTEAGGLPIAPAQVLQLQTTVGNQAIQRQLIQLRTGSTTHIQRNRERFLDFFKRSDKKENKDLGKWAGANVPNREQPLSDKEVATFMSFQNTLTNGEAMYAFLSGLNTAVGNAVQHIGATLQPPPPAGIIHAAALDMVLKQIEEQSGFNKPIETLTVAYTPDQFLDRIAAGNAYVDPGAGPEHGAFTHRVQWAAIAAEEMQQGKKNLGGKTINDYYKLAGGPRRNENGNLESIWKQLVDRELPAGVTNATKPESLRTLLELGGFVNLITAEQNASAWIAHVSLPAAPLPPPPIPQSNQN